MSSLKIIYFVCAVAFAVANPIKESKAPNKAGQDDSIDIFDATPLKREQRQNYFNPFEYYDSAPSYPSYPSYGDYSGYNPSFPRENNYFGYYPQQQPAYHRPSYYGNKKTKKNNRRKYRPFEATSQKYTVWDLARK